MPSGSGSWPGNLDQSPTYILNVDVFGCVMISYCCHVASSRAVLVGLPSSISQEPPKLAPSIYFVCVMLMLLVIAIESGVDVACHLGLLALALANILM
ncbi:hypothetical protein JB92DRAFT_1209207 [Gautieria morchelliformis]|nr:hypothetical protein JB92DRAFT_1209207 [Gautieria morchelliformis]